RLPVAGGYFAQGAEATQTAHHFRTSGAFGYALDAFDQRFARVDVDTGVLIANGGLLAHKIRAFWGRVRGRRPAIEGGPGRRAILTGLPDSDYPVPSRLPLVERLFKVWNFSSHGQGPSRESSHARHHPPACCVQPVSPRPERPGRARSRPLSGA